MNIVREVRMKTGLTQIELAARSGIAQPTISAYESGRRDPGWRVLGKIVQAAGLEVVLAARRPTPETVGRTLLELWEFADLVPQSGRPGELPPPRVFRG